MAAGERVLVVPHQFLTTLGDFQGFNPDYRRYQLAMIGRPPAFVDRDLAEKDPTQKQIIPYTVVYWVGPDKRRFYFSYRRSLKAGESRLHKQLSLGIGGHINPEDQRVTTDDVWRSVINAQGREVFEELHGVGNDRAHGHPIGMLNYDGDPVGKVHLGVVFLCKLSMPYIAPRENGMDSWAWRHAGELLENAEHYEPWSQFIIREALHIL
jgi:predicted NUDIX family phosphoesterase